MAEVKLDEKGLVPAIAQNVNTGEVLMLGYMNPGSLKRTMEGGEVLVLSRSRSDLWHKGEVSGNYMRVKSAAVDCDGDTLILQVEPDGPICHTGESNCFFTPIEDFPEFLPRGHGSRRPGGPLRHDSGPQASHAAGELHYQLIRGWRCPYSAKGDRGGGEAAIAGVKGDGEQVAEEMADLFYHALVLLSASGARPEDVWEVLRERAG